MNHHYDVHLTWDQQPGGEAWNYRTYTRQYHASIEGKPDLTGSADPTFRGDRTKHNPEDLFVIAISSCHMLSYLALCARANIEVLAYEDRATGTMSTDNRGGGKFDVVTLHPIVTIKNTDDIARAEALHEEAHATCFIANSCSVPIHHQPVTKAAS